MCCCCCGECWCSECVGCCACNNAFCGQCITGSQFCNCCFVAGSGVAICNPDCSCAGFCAAVACSPATCGSTTQAPAGCVCCNTDDCATCCCCCCCKGCTCCKRNGAGSAASNGGNGSHPLNSSPLGCKTLGNLTSALSKFGTSLTSLLSGGTKSTAAKTVAGAPIVKSPTATNCSALSSNAYLLIILVVGGLLLMLTFGNKSRGGA